MVMRAGRFVLIAGAVLGGFAACADILSADVSERNGEGSNVGAAPDSSITEDSPDAGPPSAARDAGTPAGEGLNAGDAASGGSWCAVNGVGKAGCWDFEVAGGLFNGWNERSPAAVGTLDVGAGNASQRGLLSKLAATTEATSMPRAWLRRNYAPFAGALVLDFDMTRNSCNQGPDGYGLTLAAITIGDYQTGTYWFVELLAPPYEGLRYNRLTGFSVSASEWKKSQVDLVQGKWAHVQLKVTRSTKTSASLTLAIDSKTAVDAWQVSTDPSDDSHVLIGQEKPGVNDGCAATYDNVTFDMIQ